jgi:hypothetical protein
MSVDIVLLLLSQQSLISLPIVTTHGSDQVSDVTLSYVRPFLPEGCHTGNKTFMIKMSVNILLLLLSQQSLLDIDDSSK